MTIAYDAFTHIDRSSTSPITGTHTPSGTPRGIVVLIAQNGESTDRITAVTYGGVAMTRIATAADTAGEPGRTYVYFLGSGIPTGAQTVSVTFTGTVYDKIVNCFSATASADTEVEASGVAEEDQADPAITLSTGSGVETFIVGALFSGLTTHTNLTPGTGYTEHDLIDISSQATSCIRRTSNATGGNVTIDWDTVGTSDDTAAVGIAIKESETSVPLSAYVHPETRIVRSRH